MKNTDKWQCFLKVQYDYRRMDRGWHIFSFGLMKFHKMSDDSGRAVSKDDYKGIWIRFAFWFPIDRA